MCIRVETPRADLLASTCMHTNTHMNTQVHSYQKATIKTDAPDYRGRKDYGLALAHSCFLLMRTSHP